MWRIRSKLIITTNYDKVLRWSCPDPNIDILDIENKAELGAIVSGDKRGRSLWHLHGRIDNMSDIIMTPGSYDELYGTRGGKPRYQTALESLRQLLSGRTFLFIGFSFNDLDFQSALTWVEQKFSRFAAPHYAFLHANEPQPFLRRLERLNIRPIEYQNVLQIPTALTELNQKSASVKACPQICYDAACVVNLESIGRVAAALSRVPQIVFHPSVIEAYSETRSWALNFDERITKFTSNPAQWRPWTGDDLTYFRAQVLENNRRVVKTFEDIPNQLKLLTRELRRAPTPLREGALKTFAGLASFILVDRLRYAITYIYESQDGPITGNEWISVTPWGPRVFKPPFQFADVPRRGGADYFACYPSVNPLPKLLFPGEPEFRYSQTFVRCRVGLTNSDSVYYAIPLFAARIETTFEEQREGMTDDTFYRWILPQALLHNRRLPERDRPSIILLVDEGGGHLDLTRENI